MLECRSFKWAGSVIGTSRFGGRATGRERARVQPVGDPATIEHGGPVASWCGAQLSSLRGAAAVACYRRVGRLIGNSATTPG